MANLRTGALSLEEHWKRANELKPVHEESHYSPLEVTGLKAVLPRGFLRGRIFEVHGRRSSGRTSIGLHALSEATARGEICAVVDLQHSFHPASALAAGVKLEHLVWVRCNGNAGHALRTVDLLLHAGGFGLVILDLCEANAQTLNKIPLSYWHRFRRAIEQTPTVLLMCADSSQIKSSSAIKLETKHKQTVWSGEQPFSFLSGFEAYATSGKVLSIRPQALFLKAGTDLRLA